VASNSLVITSSISPIHTHAQYMTCTVKFNEEMSKHDGLAQQNGFGLSFQHSFAEAGKRHNTREHLLLLIG
jgi:hypothetical protein